MTATTLPDSGLAGRFVAVSAINVVNHQAVLWLTNSVLGWSAVPANVTAASLAAIPAFVLSRQWVWKAQGDVRRQVLPFWVISVAGLVVSTACAAGAEAAFGAGLAVNAASFIGYFLVWIAKFFLLDRLFGDRP